MARLLPPLSSDHRGELVDALQRLVLAAGEFGVQRTLVVGQRFARWRR